MWCPPTGWEWLGPLGTVPWALMVDPALAVKGVRTEHLPALEVLNATQHVQVSCGVLLDDVHDVVGTQALLKPSLGDLELHDADDKTQSPRCERHPSQLPIHPSSLPRRSDGDGGNPI